MRRKWKQINAFAFLVAVFRCGLFSLYFQQHAQPTPFHNNGQSWVVLSPLEAQIRRKIEAAGTPLKDWDVSIYRGILTGFNDAFIIDEATKNDLIKKSPKSAEIIRPILRGRDIESYNAEYPLLWVLFISWHFPAKAPFDKEEVRNAESRLSKEYSAIYQHLLNYKKPLSARNPAETGIRYEWYALQRYGANYAHLFAQKKIVWGNLNEKAKFSIDEKGACILAPCNMLTSENENLSYLLGILNSSVTTFFMQQQGYAREGGYVEYKKQFLEHLPVPQLSKGAQSQIALLAEEATVKRSHGLSISDLEAEIDTLVFKAFGLTHQESLYLSSLNAAF